MYFVPTLCLFFNFIFGPLLAVFQGLFLALFLGITPVVLGSKPMLATCQARNLLSMLDLCGPVCQHFQYVILFSMWDSIFSVMIFYLKEIKFLQSIMSVLQFYFIWLGFTYAYVSAHNFNLCFGVFRCDSYRHITMLFAFTWYI